jgi:iron complex outermembrane receptor protein
LWGAGYRHGQDQVDPGFFAVFVPDSRTLEWGNLFIQDEFALTSRLKATLGLKLEHNDYTGSEYLPTARLAWNYSEQTLLWAAYSRGVRAPSRYDRDVYYPAPPNSIIAGGPNFQSEVANVFELGYRSQAWNRLVYSATAYYHDWDKLRSGTPVFPLKINNNIEAKVYGIELWGTFEVMQNWRVSAGGARFNNELQVKPNTNALGLHSDILSNDPRYQAQLRSTWQATHNSLLEVSVRHVAKLSNQPIPAYTALDAHYAWQIDKEWELSITGQNLADKRHREFGNSTSVNDIERAAWLAVSWHH